MTIADSDADAVIHYTVDGSKPSMASPLYLGPLTVTAKTKLRAMATDAADVPSGIARTTFKLSR